MKSVAVFVNSKGLTASPKEEGVIRVYTQVPGINAWEVTKEFEFSLIKSASIAEIRGTILNMVQRIGNCRIFAAREVAGQLYSFLEAGRFSIYETEGRPEQFLEAILSSEEENSRSTEKSTPPPPTFPEKTGIEGTYFIDLKAALAADSALTSKKILLPFLSAGDFKALEVLCDHVPRWFDSEVEKQGLISTVSKLDESTYKVVISVR